MDDALLHLATDQISVSKAVVDADIRVHVHDKPSKDPKLGKWPIVLRNEIEDTLTAGANGM